MRVSSKDVQISPQQVRDILQRESDSFGSYFDLDRIQEYISYHKLRLHKSKPYFHAISKDASYSVTKKKDTVNILRSVYNVPVGYFGENGTTLDKGVLALLQESYPKETPVGEFVHNYSSAVRDSYMISYFDQFERLEKVYELSYENHRMVKARPKWSVASTSRILASGPSVQNVAKGYTDITTAPKGYQLIYSDSGQIEPRIMYSAYVTDHVIKALIILYDDAYYGMLHFITMKPEERDAAYLNPSAILPRPITTEMQEGRQLLKLLALAGNYGSSNLDSVHPVMGPLYGKYVVNHPARIAWEKEVRLAVKSGVSTFHGFFGTPVTPEETAVYKKGSPGWFEHLVRCGINNPIQSTASELMCRSVDAAKALLRDKGHINYYKHDEGTFYVKDEYVEDLTPKLRDCLSYEVDDWIPIGSDLVVGRKAGLLDTMLFRQWDVS